MIPKIIHYCWFGSKSEPKNFKQLKATWQKYCPDYKICRWDESNFDINQFHYTKYEYEANRLDLVSDFVRLYVVEKYGGIYLDVDVEVCKSLDNLLNLAIFFGLEDSDSINSGLVIGAESGNKHLINLMRVYQSNSNEKRFLQKNCVEITTDYFRKLGFKYRDRTQVVDGCKIFSTDYFCPGGYLKLGRWHREKAYTIHHYRVQPKRTLRNMRIGRMLRLIVGRQRFNFVYYYYKEIKGVFSNGGVNL